MFSGQVLYEKAIYQLYNITFTSFPIMWYAVWDKEYEKDKPDKMKLLHRQYNDWIKGKFNFNYYNFYYRKKKIVKTPVHSIKTRKD